MRTAVILIVLAVAVPGAAQDRDPITAARFEISIDGHSFAVFSELAGISSSVDVVRSSPKTERFSVEGLVVLRRPMTSSLDMWAWHEAARFDRRQRRKNMSLTVYDEQGEPVARYQLTNAWPAKIENGPASGDARAVMMETVTLVCERIERVPQ
jgi:phage tail-like protein